MKRSLTLATLAALPTQLLAHEEGTVAHVHPHGGEALLALLVLLAIAGAVAIRFLRRP